MGNKEAQAVAEQALHDQTNLLPQRELLIVLASLSLSLLICFIDQNGIGVMLPTLARDLNAENTISWVGTSSLLANTMFTMLYGRLSDIFGRKGVFLSTLCLLCVGDLLCGFARNGPMLFVFRGIVGIAGGGIVSLTTIIISDIVPLKERGKYQGILGSSIGVGNIAGPFIAAAFIEGTAISWRGMFYLLSPLAACCIVIAYIWVPSHAQKGDMRQKMRRVDYYGSITSSAGVILLLIPISGGGSYFSWGSPMVISMLTIGACSLIVFIWVEIRIASLPMIPMDIFKNIALSTFFFQSFILGAIYQSYYYYLPLYFQNVRQWSPIQSAAMTVPISAMQAISSTLAGYYMSRFNRYMDLIWVGFGIWTSASGVTITFSETTSPAIIIVVLIFIGIGLGLTFQPILVATQAHSPKVRRAVAISVRNFFRCLGGACGLAVFATILQTSLKKNLPPGYSQLAQSTYELPNRSDISPADWDSITNAYLRASRAIFVVQTPLIGVCLLLCALVRDHGLQRPEEKPAKPQPEQASQIVDNSVHEK